MKSFAFMALVFVASTAFSQESKGTKAKEPKDMSEAMPPKEYAEYMKGCTEMIKKAQPQMDKQDLHMMCNDPYLRGHADESADDKARREKLIKFSNMMKRKAMEPLVAEGKIAPFGASEEKSEKEPKDMREAMSPGEYAEYMANCELAFKEAKPKMDAKDVEMMCNDPYLRGHKDESKADKARRERLLKQTDKDKEKILAPIVEGKKDKNKSPSSQEIKGCKKSILAADPGKDPKDAEMLCQDPYLTGKSGESYEDQVRRKRLIKEADDAKHKMMDSLVVEPKTDGPKDGHR